MKQRILIFTFLIIAFAGYAQEKWEFSNSTPYETVKSHFYFLEQSHYNLALATYTFGDTELSKSNRKSYIVKLKSILVKLKVKPEEVLNRKKGIVYKDKYQLSPKEDLIYLERINRKWVYSEETVKAIPKLYQKYIIGISGGPKKENKKRDIVIKHIIAQDSNGVEFSLITPAKTIISHLIYLSDTLFNPELAAQTINVAPEDTAHAQELAIMLKQIYMGAENQVFAIEELSNDTNFQDSITGAHIYHPNADYPELFLEKIGDKWLYSRNTSKLIRSVHEDMYQGEAEEVFKFSDKFKRWAGVNNNQLIGKVLKKWQLLMIIYFLSILLVLYIFNHFITKLIFRKLLGKSPFHKVALTIFTTITYIILFTIIRNYAPSFEFSIEYNHILLKIIHLALIFYYTLLAIYIVNFLKIFFTLGHSNDSRFGIVLFASLIIKTMIFTASMLFVIDTLNFNLFNFLAGLSIGGFALALGAQDTVKNFLGSLMIFADKSFRVGDWISNGEVDGTVEEIGLRSTKIRTFHNSVVTVPNSLLSDNNIDNLGRRIYRRYKTTMVIKYETPSAKIEEFTNRINQLIENQKETRKDFFMVYMSDFSSFGVEVLIYTFFQVSDWKQEMKAKHELIKSILDVKDELGIEFSVPLIAKTDN